MILSGQRLRYRPATNPINTPITPENSHAEKSRINEGPARWRITSITGML